MSASVEVYDNRADWLRARKAGIGASEMAAVMGISPHASPYSVWADKVTDEIDDRPPTGRQYWGTRLEGLIADEFAAQMDGVQVQDPGPYTIYRDVANHMFATPDRLVEHADGTTFVLELKTAGLDRWHDWDECPPAQYLIQVQHQIAVTVAAGGYIAVLIGGNEFRVYPIPRDEEMIADIRAAASEFWEFVERREPPEIDGHNATTEALKRRYPAGDDELAVELPPTLVWATEELAELKVKQKDLDDRKAELENRIKAEMGDATIGRLGKYTWTWKETARKGSLSIPDVTDEAKAALDEAGVAYKETPATSYRVLRVKATKEAE